MKKRKASALVREPQRQFVRAVDGIAYAKNTIGWFVRDFPRTDYLVKQVRLTLQTNRVWGYNEIDAVQLVGEK